MHGSCRQEITEDTQKAPQHDQSFILEKFYPVIKYTYLWLVLELFILDGNFHWWYRIYIFQLMQCDASRSFHRHSYFIPLPFIDCLPLSCPCCLCQLIFHRTNLYFLFRNWHDVLFEPLRLLWHNCFTSVSTNAQSRI